MMLAILVYHIVVTFLPVQELTNLHFWKSQALIRKAFNFMKTKKAKNTTNNHVATEQVNQRSQSVLLY